MIVGLFNDSFPPIVDGVTRVLLSYAQELKKSGDRTIAIVPNIPGMTTEGHGFEVMAFSSFPAPARPEYRWGIGVMDPKFWKHIKDIPFDIVHTHCPFSSHMVAKTLASRHDIPLVSTFHTKYRDDFMAIVKNPAIVDNVLIKSMINTYESADEVWTVNEASAETLREYGYNNNIYIMRNGCDIEPSRPDDSISRRIRERYSLSDAPILLYIGQHIYQKNVIMLIDALKLLSDSGVDFNMLFLGDGPQHDAMKETVKRYGLDAKTHFLGVIHERELVKEIYLTCSALLFPSLYDTSSLVPREAAACRCPTLFVNGSSTAEGIVNNQNGFLADNTPESFASSIQAIITDKELRNSVAEQAFLTLYRPWSDAVKLARERYIYLIDKKKHGSNKS